MVNGLTQSQAQPLKSLVRLVASESRDMFSCIVDPATDNVIGSCPEMSVSPAQCNALGSHNVHLGHLRIRTLLFR